MQRKERGAGLFQLISYGWRRDGLDNDGKRSWKVMEGQIMEELLATLRILALVSRETWLRVVF